MSIRKFGKAVQFQMSEILIINQFSFNKFNICFHSVPKKKKKLKTGFTNVDTDQGSKNLWFNIHVILLYCFVSKSHCQVMLSTGVIKLTIDKIK